MSIDDVWKMAVVTPEPTSVKGFAGHDHCVMTNVTADGTSTSRSVVR
jgi:hypothetical protein